MATEKQQTPATPESNHAAYLGSLAQAPIGAPVQKGEKSRDVRAMQERLMALGYSVGPTHADGDFGPHTEQGLRRFQHDHHLPGNGTVADPTTLEALNTALREKAAHPGNGKKSAKGKDEAEVPPFLSSPFKFNSHITSGMGMRMCPVGPNQGTPEFHNGVDIGCGGSGGIGYGEPIYAGAKGEVIGIGHDELGGNTVKVRFENGFTAEYMHVTAADGLHGPTFDKKGTPVGPGSQVDSSTPIARVDQSGAHDGAHVFILLKDPSGHVVDPKLYMQGIDDRSAEHPMVRADQVIPPAMRMAVSQAIAPPPVEPPPHQLAANTPVHHGLHTSSHAQSTTTPQHRA